MNRTTANLILQRSYLAPCVAVLACLLALAISAAPQATAKSSSTAVAKPRTFDTAYRAADALIKAAANWDVPGLKAIFGPDGQDVFLTGESAADRQRAATFAALAREKRIVVIDPKNKNRAVVTVGHKDWPMPVPLVKKGGRWSYDAAAGRREMLYRRIGENELDAIRLCRRYVEAQHEYALQKRDGSPVNQYAQRIISTDGKKDGLAWRNPDGTWSGPINEPIARAIQLGYTSRAEPYHGYFFKVLKGQGPAAPLGQMDFVVKGVMIGGFALVAAPAQYRVTGVKTFIVSHDGVVYQKDFGTATAQAFKKMERFNPDKTWQPVPVK
jgi:hypothetical protein